jgi:integrase
MSIWTVDQARRFLDHVAAKDLQAHVLFALVLSSGLRRGEAIALRWSDVDLDAGALRVVRSIITVGGQVQVSEPKTARGRRRIALDPTTVGLLRRQRARQVQRQLLAGALWREDDLVFSRDDGTSLRPDHVSRSFARFAKTADVPVNRLHDARHTAASFMLAAGVPAKVASERLGHSSISLTLDTYSHVLPGLDEDAAARTASLVYRNG